MRVGHRRSYRMPERTERIDAHGDLKLFDRAIHVSQINLSPSSREHQIRIKLDGAGKKNGTLLDIAYNINKAEASHRQHSRIVSIEFDCVSGEPVGFGYFSRDIHAPAKRLSLRKAESRKRIGQSKLRADRAGGFFTSAIRQTA